MTSRPYGTSKRARPRVVACAIEQRGAVSVAGVRFHAGGVAPFSDATLADVTDLVVPVDRIFGAEALDLERALRAAAGDPEGQRRLFDAFLLGRRRRDRGRATFARSPDWWGPRPTPPSPRRPPPAP